MQNDREAEKDKEEILSRAEWAANDGSFISIVPRSRNKNVSEQIAIITLLHPQENDFTLRRKCYFAVNNSQL